MSGLHSKLPIPGLMAFTLILFSSLSYTPFAPSVLGYGLTALLLTAITVYWVYSDATIHAPARESWLLLILYGLFLAHLTGAALRGTISGAPLARTLAFIGSSAFFLFIFPRVVPFRSFIRGLVLISTVLTVLGLSASLAAPYGIDIPFVGTWEFPPYTGIRIPAVTSILKNPNFYSLLTALATVAALYEAQERGTRTFTWGLFAALLFVGTILSGSRGSVFALIGGLFLFLVSQYISDEMFRWSVGAITGGFLIGFLMLAGLLPEIPPLSKVSFTGRRVLWEASIQAISENPFGYGIGKTNPYIREYITENRFIDNHQHNSFLRIGLFLGIIGGIIYIVLHLQVLNRLTSGSSSMQNRVLTVLFIIVILKQMLASFTLFGLSIMSILSCLVVGYSFTQCTLSSNFDDGKELNRIPKNTMK